MGLKVTFGLDADVASFEELAQLLSAALQVPLYRMHSPMIGPWYSSLDFAPMQRALRAGDREKIAQLASEEKNSRLGVMLRLNDAEPGYLSPEHPGTGTYLLELQLADPGQLQAMEQALQGVCRIRGCPA